MNTLLENLSSDITHFFDSKKKSSDVFCNECDLQLQLARYLSCSSRGYDKIHLEYFIPSRAVEQQMKDKLLSVSDYKPQNLYIDIVVEKDGEFLPIELKYKTVPLNKDISCFGETVNGENLLKNHGARDLGAYDFWRDVSRIECLIKRFNNVKSGIALFVTNDQGYWTLPKMGTNPNYANFSMKDAVHNQKKTWQGNTAMSAARPSFVLDNEHKLEWQPQIKKEYKWPVKEFRYCLLKIN